MRITSKVKESLSTQNKHESQYSNQCQNSPRRKFLRATMAGATFGLVSNLGFNVVFSRPALAQSTITPDGALQEFGRRRGRRDRGFHVTILPDARQPPYPMGVKPVAARQGSRQPGLQSWASSLRVWTGCRSVRFPPINRGMHRAPVQGATSRIPGATVRSCSSLRQWQAV